MSRKPKFKVGQVVAGANELPGILSKNELIRIGWKEWKGEQWIYRTQRWASIGYEEYTLRPLTKRERGQP